MISLFTGRRFCAEVARTLGVKPNLLGSVLLEVGVTWAHLKALKRANYSADEAVEVLLPDFANGLALVKARFGDQPEILEAERAIENRMEESNGDLNARAYEYAHDVLSEVGIIEGLASLHRLGFENQEDEAELRGIVLGSYRTVAVGGALAARFMDTEQRPKEDMSRAFWNFVNESAVRGIALDISDALLPDEPSPVGIIEREFETLFACGYEIGRLHGEGAIADAFEVWRNTMKAPITESDAAHEQEKRDDPGEQIISSEYPEGRYELTYHLQTKERIRGRNTGNAVEYVLRSDDLETLYNIGLAKMSGGASVKLTDSETDQHIPLNSEHLPEQ